VSLILVMGGARAG